MDVRIIIRYLMLLDVLVICKAMKCNPYGKCGCLLEDGSRSIDLSPLVKAVGKSPMFTKVAGKAAGYLFDIDLCNAFICGNAKSKICLKVFTTGVDVGNELTFDYKTGVVTFIYSTTIDQKTVTTRVTMHCTTKDGPGSFVPIENNADQTVFTTTFTSKYACFVEHKKGGDDPGSPHKLSNGSILCIVLLVLVIVYLVGGILINKYVRKVEDGSYIPNKSFWKDLPGLIKDGCSFSFSKIRRKNDEYEKI